jgi:hypothetical protein
MFAPKPLRASAENFETPPHGGSGSKNGTGQCDLDWHNTAARCDEPVRPSTVISRIRLTPGDSAVAASSTSRADKRTARRRSTSRRPWIERVLLNDVREHEQHDHRQRHAEQPQDDWHDSTP